MAALEYDEGPTYQTARLSRYREMAEQMITAGQAYYAYETREELDAMRNQAMARNEKPRYNGHYRDLNAPFRDDPARSRYEKFAEKTYLFTLSDEVPGRVVELRSELVSPSALRGNGREVVISEPLRFVRER